MKTQEHGPKLERPAALIYMGTPDFAVPPLRALATAGYDIRAVVCQPDKPQGRHMRLGAPALKLAAQELGIPVLQPSKIRTENCLEQLRAFQPDLIVTAAYGRILPPAILELPPHGCLNLHASLLPKYRGAAPVQHALINGDSVTGVTLMRMDEGMDTGDILLQAEWRIAPDLNAGELTDQLSELAAQLAPRGVAEWLAGTLKPRPQNEAEATQAPPLTRDSGRIDWQLPAARIADLVRGTTPWPGAWTTHGTNRLKIHRAAVNTDPELMIAASGSVPGTIISCGGRRIHVACGEGVLVLLELQSASGRRMMSEECAHNYRPGIRLGEESI